MACKYLDEDLGKIVRCSFTERKVCRQWVNQRNMDSTNPYRFCEKQSKVFEPIVSHGWEDDD